MLDGAFIANLIAWGIGGLAVAGAVLTTLAFWEMGRSAYRKD
ncbi:hypothetical protein ACPW96_09845 [Micromonospora sp. DT81.3]